MDPKLESQEILPLGISNFRSRQVTFGIKPEDRMRHIYLIGKTGVGKTTLMQSMIAEDLKAGRGMCIIDPHNDFAERTIGLVPKSRINDTIYFNPADIDFPFAFNIMEAEDDVRKKSLIASSVVGTFKKIFAESWGPRLEYLLRNTIYALLDSPGNTLLGVPRMLVDKSFRKKIVKNIKDPIVKAFWEDEFTKYNQSFQVEAASPIQNKIGQFLSSEVSRNIFGQSKSSLDLKDIMDNRKILVCNFSKGKIGEDYSQFLGAMMITKLQITAMERADVPEADRTPFYLYVDEFQNFVSEAFATILSEARKFKLSLIIAHQYLEQLGEEVQAAVLGNVGTIVCFRVGAEDALVLSREFSPMFGADDLVNLDRGAIYIKLMIDGTISQPFSATTINYDFGEGDEEVMRNVIKVSRERYGNPRSEIQEKIKKWMGPGKHRDEDDDNQQQRPRYNNNYRGQRNYGGRNDHNRSRNNYQNPRNRRYDRRPEPPKPAVKSISLSDAMKEGPIDFKGKKIKEKKIQPENKEESKKIQQKDKNTKANDAEKSGGDNSANGGGKTFNFAG